MHIRPLFAIAAVVGLAGLFAYVMGVVQAASHVGLGWQGLSSAWPFILAGVLSVAAVLGGFVWLALYSHDQGYDDRANPHRH